MYTDHGSHTERDAGLTDAAYGGYEPDGPSLSDLTEDDFRPTRKVPMSTGDLVQSMRAVVTGGYTKHYGRRVEVTSPGVVSFALHESDRIEAMTVMLTFLGVESKVVDGRMFGRCAQ